MNLNVAQNSQYMKNKNKHNNTSSGKPIKMLFDEFTITTNKGKWERTDVGQR